VRAKDIFGMTRQESM